MVTNKVSEIYNGIVSLIDYLNPFSENFILKVAFIPEEGYFQRKIDELRIKAEESVGLLGQLKDTFNAVAEAVTDEDEWEGVKVDMFSYGVGAVGEVTIVDPSFINYAGPKIKFWISGLIWFMLLLWLIRRIAGFWGRGET